MTPARAAEVLRYESHWASKTEATACEMGAEALEFCEWLFACDVYGYPQAKHVYNNWHGAISFLDYARAEWKKERKGNGSGI